VANELGIEVIDLIARMMHSGFRKNKWGSNEKQAMMIDIFLAQI
jgi:hypothetical protein